MNITKGKLSIKKGNPLPLGTCCYEAGVNFSIALPNALECNLNIYNKGEKEAFAVICLESSDKTGDVFSVFINGFDVANYEYMYEVMGREFPDPMSKKISGRDIWGKPLDLSMKKMVRSMIYEDGFDWKDDKNPNIPYEDAIFYKAHLRGYTKHSSSGVNKKGTFAGFTKKIPYLKELGITSVILMPVYEFDEIIYDKYLMRPMEVEFVEYGEFLKEQQEVCDDPVLSHYEKYQGSKGIIPYKVNYWGYGTEDTYYFAPKSSYAFEPDRACDEFKELIRALHSNGIECILEMVFPEGINRQFVCECFRYWILEYHIDGFKYNASAINGEFVATDPLLGATKLICEGWNEYGIYNNVCPINRNLCVMNDDFMNNARRFLKGDEEQAGDFSYKFRRNPDKTGIINYITNSNGFTLMDLYSYDIKHNEDNFESNRDGTDYNYSWNCGCEGKTRKKKVLALRKKQIKNALTILLLSQGSPMILAGDELGNTQEGNNNAYCQDNNINWINWTRNKQSIEILSFVKELIAIRKQHRILHMKKELRVMDYVSLGCPDLSYHGTRAWYPEYNVYSRTLGILLYGKYAGVKEDASFYIAINMHWEEHEFDIPRLPQECDWICILDNATEQKDFVTKENKFKVAARNIVVFMSKEKPKKCKKNDIHPSKMNVISKN